LTELFSLLVGDSYFAALSLFSPELVAGFMSPAPRLFSQYNRTNEEKNDNKKQQKNK